MKVLLSIRPEYVKRIFAGEKKYEYRRSLFKRNDVETIVVYATKPIGKVVGEFQIGDIIEDDPMIIWERTKLYSGIRKKDYMDYFKKRDKGFAISIKNIFMYDTPLELKELNPEIKTAPQSFRYIF
ncbi:ASCH domain-containing protein [Clostridium botulinum]|uniref:ASCH domain-containing protein n=1 Tax=Clostridium botulinum TaxID=1491 RepID=UPI000174E6BF|nr:ASCH domain-containing protein [Clostridium botulinum]ACD52060.1 putative protein [Clostridium botulinum E3 str. Alaska E43]MBY6816495.1 ASCH domain-containing protein [Clostridium botulinum]MBY6827250.1 ASCH domain-containing protein [Clostridium botulinum]MBY6859198.1 ASCH domain-containing protein [Clostridium botulinum]MBY7041518.1 ASCH domain-containing protein [Clostridium botulinum]